MSIEQEQNFPTFEEQIEASVLVDRHLLVLTNEDN